MPSPSELQRYDEHGPIKAGVVFDRAPRFESTDGTALDRCRVEQPAPPARVNRRTGEAEHPAERAAREYGEAAVISLPEVVELRRRVAELESAIRLHRDQRGDDRCWLDDRQLYAALPEGYTPPAEDSAVELERCQQYIRCRHDPATVYVSPQRRIDELESELAAKNRFVAAMCERLKAAHDVIARHAEREAERDPWPLDELEQYAGEHV